MQYKQIKNKYIIRIDPGEEIVETLKKFCKTHNITAGTITGLGATNNVSIGLFELKTKTYHSKTFTDDHEIAPLYGNITTMNNDIYLHLHINICDTKHQSYSGHLNKAVVSATFEGVIEQIDGTIQREFNETMKLNLLSLK